MSDDLYDPYADGNGGGGGAPVISWNYAKVGETFTGVVMPPEPLTKPGSGYKVGREWQDGTDQDPDDKGFLVWPAKDNTEGIKRPVTEKRFRALWPDQVEEMRSTSRVEITMATEYTDGEFLSDNAVKRMKEDGVDPKSVTERRVLRSGPDLPTKFDAALKEIGARSPMPGQRWTITLTDREDNKGGKGKTRRHAVKVEEPTAATKAMVQAYIEKATSAAPSEAGDPYGEEPPF